MSTGPDAAAAHVRLNAGCGVHSVTSSGRAQSSFTSVRDWLMIGWNAWHDMMTVISHGNSDTMPSAVTAARVIIRNAGLWVLAVIQIACTTCLEELIHCSCR